MSQRSWDAATFDRLYAESSDPWRFESSAYEQAKYAATLAALPRHHFKSAFEIGCSIGVLTERLAARCDALLAVDVAAAALAVAERRCHALGQVRFACLQVPGEWPAATFDLILWSEVLYFLDRGDIARAANLTVASLRPDGIVLLVNYTGPNDAPCTGDSAAETFAASATGLRPISHWREPDYRIDLLRAG